MTNTTNRNTIECRKCGLLPTLYLVRYTSYIEDGYLECEESFSAIDLNNLTDDQWLNGASIDDSFRYVFRCECADRRYDNPEAALRAWQQSGPGGA